MRKNQTKAGTRTGLSIMLLCLLPVFASGQMTHPVSNIQFYQLNTAHGLSDNYIYAMTMDRNGYLWVGTGEGLNRFNGKSVEKYFSADYPALQNDYIKQIVCDTQNRLWVLTDKGNITLIDEMRKFHRIGLYINGQFEPTRRILETDAHGLILFTKNGHLKAKYAPSLNHRDSLQMNDFASVHITGGDSLYNRSFSYIVRGGGNEYYYATDQEIYVGDFGHDQNNLRVPCLSCRPLGVWKNGEILVYNTDQKDLLAIDPKTNQSYAPLKDIKDQHGRTMTAFVYAVQRITPDQYLITTRGAGVYAYTISTHTLINYRHDAADPTTVVNDNPNLITSDSTGWVFISATPNGISYFNHKAVIGQQLIFQDRKGTTYDGYVNNLTTRDNDTYYIGTSEYLIEWKRSTNATAFMQFPLPQELAELENDQIVYVTFDRFNHLWVATHRSGLYVLDKQKKLLHHFPFAKEERHKPFGSNITHLREGPDGNMWMSTQKGVMAIDPLTYRAVDLKSTPLADLEGINCFRVEHFDPEYLYICSEKGVWQYTLGTMEVKKYNEESGLVNNRVFCINKDQSGNYYFGTPLGLSILLTDGRYLVFNEKNGLLNKRVEALLADKQNRMWIGNDVGLACFSIADTTIRAFDERYGLSIQGFRINAYHQNDDDELLWGTERGLQYFYPDDLYAQNIELRTTILRMESKDIAAYITRSETFDLAPGNDFISFQFSTIDYSTHLRTFYQYQLEGLDKAWINVSDQNVVRYNSLKPGDYTFRVRASNDKKTWVAAENEIRIHLAAHFWHREWFKLLSLFGLGVLGYAMISYFTRKQKQRTEELETEVVVNYFASQINRHKNTDEMLWDVAKNCISKLNLEECVIYLLDPNRKVLIQKAAYGPKNPSGNTILQPIEVEVGHGITGTVAQTLVAEIINNTERDPRYIVDDTRRYAEIAVPIVNEGEVIGVIDSEHSQKNFFTQKHMSLLTTIAILTANQIQRIRAEEEKQKAQIEVLQNKQKATESRLQSLRLQMNPHFLFNALNSIQQMILANEEMVATKYLSRFSKLLRSILIHSDKESISLREELDILNLYVELESVRFKEAFTYEIICDEEIDTDEVKIPTLLIQPFVENAIWHGLMHKEGMRKLKISFTDKEDHVQCIIEDNGIGRQAAREMKITSGQDKKHTSKGIEVSLERLNVLNKNGAVTGSLEIIDLRDPQGRATGTRVEINLPIQN